MLVTLNKSHVFHISRANARLPTGYLLSGSRPSLAVGVPHAYYATAKSSTSQQQQQQQQEEQNVIPSWNEYFKLRSKRRNYEIAAYFPSTVLPVLGTGAYMFQLKVDPFTTFLGMDPMIAAVLAMVGSGVCGYLAGPVIGDSIFRLMNRKIMPAMDERDKLFYEHIKKNRSSARLNSIRNPVPDYYGEKIRSVADYRSWLRKQREHYRKAVFGGSGVGDDF